VNWLVTLIVALIKILLPALTAKAKRTSENGARDGELAKRLGRRIENTWGALRVFLAAAVLACTFSGCAARTIYVPDGAPVRLRETVRNVKIWVLDGNGDPVAGKMDLPEGWYALSDPGKD